MTRTHLVLEPHDHPFLEIVPDLLLLDDLRILLVGDHILIPIVTALLPIIAMFDQI